MSKPLNPMQRHVADHYEGGEYAFVQTSEEAAAVGDTLFLFCMLEAGDAQDMTEYAAMLARAIYQLHSVHNGMGKLK